jgi:outer membrane protein assembly factor BamB
VLLVVALKAGAQWSGRPPGIMTVFAPPKDAGIANRRALITSALLLTVALAALPMFRRPAPQVADTQPASVPAVSLADLFANWPSFHGPQGSGVTTFPSAPTSWDGPSLKNIAWKTPVPLPGQNSPIVWADRVFLSGATADKQEVFCFNLNTGALLWRRTVAGPFHGDDVQPAEDAGFAPNTLATDGRRVYALFPTGDLAAFDLDGKALWSKNLGKPDSTYGLAASLATHLDRVIVQFDQGADEKKSTSALYCLDGASGNEIWKTRRQLPSSWCSPIVIYPENNVGKAQIVCAGRPWLIAYDPANGHELWKAELLEAEVAPSPVFAGDKVFVANEGAVAAAVTLEGKVLWKAEDGLPDIVSPLATKDFLLTTTTSGMLACYNADNGEKRWEHDLEASVYASPILVGNLVYLLDTKGTMHIFEALPGFKEIDTPAIHEEVAGSPALVAGKIIIRGKKNLYCITGEPAR